MVGWGGEGAGGGSFHTRSREWAGVRVPFHTRSNHLNVLCTSDTASDKVVPTIHNNPSVRTRVSPTFSPFYYRWTLKSQVSATTSGEKLHSAG